MGVERFDRMDQFQLRKYEWVRGFKLQRLRRFIRQFPWLGME